jgi:uncharacterized protein
LYIKVSEIPRQGFEVIASRGKAWIPKVLDGMDPFPLTTCRMLSAGLLLTLTGKDLLVDGSFEAEGEASCDRCMEMFKVRLEKGFQTVLVPRDRGPAGASNVELHEGDLDVGFYDGAGVEVADIFWEQVALTLPVKLLCSEECRGICPSCGCNRNVGDCGCAGESPSGPFGWLITLK